MTLDTTKQITADKKTIGAVDIKNSNPKIRPMRVLIPTEKTLQHPDTCIFLPPNILK